MNKPNFAIYFFKWGFWMRFFGRLLWVARDDGTLLFSERYGYTKVWRGLGLKVKVER